MRIASYNILSGGFDQYRKDLKKSRRFNVLKQAIIKLNADFIGLIDTYRWDEIYTNKQIAELFSYKKAYCINLNDDRLRRIGHNNGITVLTNNEVKSVETISLKTRDAIRARMIIDEKGVDVYTVYLDDLSEDARVEQVIALLRQIDMNYPSIIMGDLNALKKEDVSKLKPLIDKFFLVNPELLAGYEDVLKQMMVGTALSKIEGGGFVDATHIMQATAPTKLFPAKLEDPILRLDYAYYRGKVKISNFEVRREEIFDRASDHYPIVFDCLLD